MQLWVGLGNPGAKYSLHRHNVGFMAADIIAEVHDFGPWQKKFRSLIAEGRIGRHRVLLLKPQTFMNDSGDAVQQTLRFYKLDVDALTAFHDELDLAPFKVKVRVGGGLAGHNGLRSLARHLGTQEFLRLRIGVGRPERGDPRPLADWVLANFEPHEDVDSLVARAADAVETLVTSGLETTQQQFN
jgi:PTH1 family peptidyl-tRNA hydrolase